MENLKEAVAEILNWIEEVNKVDDMLLVDDSCSALYESDIVQISDEDVEVRRPSRKLITKNRLVHDIDSSLNEECYNYIDFLNGKVQWALAT